MSCLHYLESTCDRAVNSRLLLQRQKMPGSQSKLVELTKTHDIILLLLHYYVVVFIVVNSQDLKFTRSVCQCTSEITLSQWWYGSVCGVWIHAGISVATTQQRCRQTCCCRLQKLVSGLSLLHVSVCKTSLYSCAAAEFCCVVKIWPVIASVITEIDRFWSWLENAVFMAGKHHLCIMSSSGRTRAGPWQPSSSLVHLLPHLFPLFSFLFLSLALPIFFCPSLPFLPE